MRAEDGQALAREHMRDLADDAPCEWPVGVTKRNVLFLFLEGFNHAGFGAKPEQKHSRRPDFQYIPSPKKKIALRRASCTCSF